MMQLYFDLKNNFKNRIPKRQYGKMNQIFQHLRKQKTKTCVNNIENRVDEMAQVVKMLASKPHNLILIPRIHTEGSHSQSCPLLTEVSVPSASTVVQ